MLKDTDFTFASIRVRAAEGKGSPKERLAHLTAAATEEQLRAAVTDFTDVSPGEPLETALCRAQSEAAALLRDAVEDVAPYRFLFYPYDCCNVKMALKNEIRPSGAADDPFPFGSVPAEDVRKAIETRQWQALPVHMAAAAAEAIAAAEAGDTREIDLLLDKACFADMLDNVKESGVPFFLDYVSGKADGVNILSAMRLSRLGMQDAAAVSFFSRAFVPGGTMPEKAFLSGDGRLADGETIAERAPAELRDAVKKIAAESLSAGEAEYLLDEARGKRIAKVRSKPFGPEIPAIFFLTRDFEIQAARLLAAGIRAGRPREETERKVRVQYV